LPCQQFRLAKLKEQCPRYYKTSRWFFSQLSVFSYGTELRGGDASIKDITTRWPSRSSSDTKPDLTTLSSLKRLLCRGAELPHLHTAVPERKCMLSSAFQAKRPVLAAINQNASMGWKASQLPTPPSQEMGSQEHHG